MLQPLPIRVRCDAVFTGALLLTVYAGGGLSPAQEDAPVPAPATTLAPRPAIYHAAPPPAEVIKLPGLEGVVGADGATLIRQFGPPRLDVAEGDARKLQFTGTACILDVYLYPPAPGAEPRATYVDARRGDGHDVDRAACVAALRRH